MGRELFGYQPNLLQQYHRNSFCIEIFQEFLTLSQQLINNPVSSITAQTMMSGYLLFLEKQRP